MAAKYRTSNKFALATLAIIGSLFFIFLIWASLAEIDVVTRGEGQVIPSQKTQLISNLEGGIIKSILVKEGELVQPNQVLMTLDPKIAEVHYKTRREAYIRYLLASQRLQAQLDGTEFKVSDEVQKEFPAIAEEEITHFFERKRQLETQQSIAKQVVVQKKQELEEEKSRTEQARDQLDLSEQELKMVAPLVAEELISKREILRLKRDVANLKGEMAKGKAALPKAQAALEQAQYELEQVPIRFHNEDQEQLREIKIKLAEAEGAMLEYHDRMIRTDLRSPVKGIVKLIKTKTIGGVIHGDEDVIEIVPYEDTLLIEARILPSDVAFIRSGQEARVKVTAYDYSIYGSLKADLIEISADTVRDQEQKKDFYRVLLRTDKNYLEYNGKKLPIIPGMTVEVDILTGSRTIMQYLLKPIIRGATESFKER